MDKATKKIKESQKTTVFRLRSRMLRFRQSMNVHLITFEATRPNNMTKILALVGKETAFL